MKEAQSRIRALREDKDMTQKQVATYLKRSQQGYAHLENGKAKLDIDDLKELCKLYEISADYIIGLIDTPTTYKRKN